MAMKLNRTSWTKLLLWPRKTIHKSWITGEKHLHKRYSYENDIMQAHRIEFCFLLVLGNTAFRIRAGLFVQHISRKAACPTTSPTRNLYQNATASSTPGNKFMAEKRLQPDAGSCVLVLFRAHGDALGILSSSNCWRTTGKDILLTSIYSSSGWRGRLSQNG